MISKYPERVIAEALHPTSGIATKHKFLPSLADFKTELDLVASKEYSALSYEHRIRQQLLDRQPLPEHRTDKTHEELMAPYYAAVGKQAHKTPEMTVDEFLAKYPHVSRAEFEAIPDRSNDRWRKVR